MKKLFLTLLMLVAAVPVLMAQGDGITIKAAIFSGSYTAYKSTPTPSASDVTLSYNVADKTYSGVVSLNLSTTSQYNFLKFYSVEGSTTTYYGPRSEYGASGVGIQFGSTPSQTYEIFSNTSADEVGAFYANTLPSGKSSADIKVTLNLETNTATLSLYNGEDNVGPEGDAVFLAFGTSPTSIVPSESDLFVEETSDGVYSGRIRMPNTIYFRLYTKNGSTITTYAPVGITQISFVDITDSWPDAANAAQAKFVEDGKGYWYYGNLPYGSLGNIDFTVDFNTMSITFAPVYERAEAPEAVYIWATEDGFEGTAVWKNVATLNPSAADANVFEATIDVPECGPFMVDEESKPMEGDPTDRGYYFYLSRNGVNKDATKDWFTLPLENHLIDIPAVGDTFQATVFEGSLGSLMICLSPGRVKVTLNYETLEFTMTMLTPETEEEPFDGEKLYMENAMLAPGNPTPSDTNQYIEEISANVFQGTVSLKQGESFRFYRGETVYAPASQTPVSFAYSYQWPVNNDFQDEESGIVVENGKGKWYISRSPADGNGTYVVKIDLNSMRIELTANSKEFVAPEEVYIWIPKPNDPEMLSFQIEKTMERVSVDPAVYTVEWNVPEVTGLLVEEKDGPDHGQYFFISPDTKISSSMTRYLAWQGSEEGDMFNAYEFSDTETSVKLPVILNFGSGANNFVQLTPGMTTLTLNLTEMFLTATYQGGSGVDAVEVADGDAVYFNLQGQRVSNPDRGIFIRVAGGKAVKVVK